MSSGYSTKPGTTAIVTGGASGLGKAVAKRFAQQGIHVAIVDISRASGEMVQDEIHQNGLSCTYYHGDVSDQRTASFLVETIATNFKRIDILVNAAGIIRRTGAANVPASELDAVLDVNLKGIVYMSQAAQPIMTAGGGGAIVNFASMLAHYGSRNLLSYAASKGGVVQVTKCCAVEWAECNIRVNAVSPGYIETPLSAGATKDPAFHERILSRTPQRRYGTPEEVAAVVEFLASDSASFITGVVLPVDGGLLAGDPMLFPPASSRA